MISHPAHPLHEELTCADMSACGVRSGVTFLDGENNSVDAEGALPHIVAFYYLSFQGLSLSQSLAVFLVCSALSTLSPRSSLPLISLSNSLHLSLLSQISSISPLPIYL